ncbi:hypothetical protein [Methylicorpusculum sp.]|uniref:hypothetical protein n=1 Tax=Methylicorpusculum sp. TaxID=2713644 RepID=UPI002ABB06A6|nr:hypothetical protein [Methylicorpusculum sp.]MDZ4150326.1 hypothetical protein [Methylicorpusculum sp.]
MNQSLLFANATINKINVLLVALCMYGTTSSLLAMHQQATKIQTPSASNNPFITIAQQEQPAGTHDSYLNLAVYKNGRPNAYVSLANAVQPTMSLEELGDKLGFPAKELNEYLERWNLSKNHLIYLIQSIQEEEQENFCLSDWEVLHRIGMAHTLRIQESSPTGSQNQAEATDIISLSSREGSPESAILSLSDLSNESVPEETEHGYKDTHTPQAPTDDKAYYHSQYQSDSDSEDPTWQTLKNKKERYHKRTYNAHKQKHHTAHQS